MKKMAVLATCLMFLQPSYVYSGSLTFDLDGLLRAQLRLTTALEIVKTVLEKKECRVAILRNYKINLDKEEIRIPVVLVNNLFYGGLDENSRLTTVPWEEGDMANNICAKLKNSNNKLNYINVSLDTVLLSDEAHLAFVIFHEVLHFFQCYKNTLTTEDQAHRLMEQSEIFSACHP